jgi:hypothetical protein
MSVGALCIVLAHAAVYGVVHERDEGAAAHVFQLLMTLQWLIVGYFLLKWARQAPRLAAPVVALQVALWLLAAAAAALLT